MSRSHDERTELLELNKQVDQIKDKTKDNLKKAEQRDYNVRILSEEVDHVNQSAKDFNKTTKDLNRAECCKKYKLWIILVTIVVVVILVLAVILIGVFVYLFKR